MIRPPGLELTLDGNPVSTTWRAVAGREVGTIPVSGGTHTISGGGGFGLISFGLGTFTSYASLAGLNLDKITLVY